MVFKLAKFKCKKCGHIWRPRKEDVRQCPKCKTAYWEKKRKIKRETHGGASS